MSLIYIIPNYLLVLTTGPPMHLFTEDVKVVLKCNNEAALITILYGSNMTIYDCVM